MHSKVIGVLGYQGGCDLHIEALNKLNIPHKKVLYQDDLTDLSGLILPGGESSVQYQYCTKYGIIDKICDFAKSGKPILGTCAGSILLSNIKSDRVTGLGLIDIEIQRNVYGSQICSGIKTSDNGNQVMFIRAPGITAYGENVKVLDSYQGKPIFVSQGNIHCTTFHPELLNLDATNIIYNLFL